MILNRCTSFTAIDGGGSSDLDGRIYELFSNLEVSEIADNPTLQDFQFKEGIVDGEAGVIEVTMLVVVSKNSLDTLYRYFIQRGDIGCFCELLIFILVNFRLTHYSEPSLLQAFEIYGPSHHIMYYRYNEELNRLFEYLKDAPNTKRIIHFLWDNYLKAYPVDRE